MNQKNTIMRVYGLWLLDMICIILSYFIATQLRFAQHNDWGSKTLHYMVMVVFLLFCTVYGYFVDWNRDVLKRGYFAEFMAVMPFNAVMIGVSLIFVFFAQWAYILSRTVIFNFAWINTLLMYAGHLLFKRVMARVLSGDLMSTKLLVVCEKDREDDTIKRVREELGDGYQIAGAVAVDGKNEAQLREVTEKMTQVPFDEVLINAPSLDAAGLSVLVDGFDKMGVDCRYTLSLPDAGIPVSRVEKYGGFTVATYTRFRSSYKRLLIKRAADIAGGAAGLIITGILTIFIAPAIKLDSPGPVFFSQTRVGKNGRRFKIYKFRSMYTDAEERKKELAGLNEMNGLMFKMKKDPRITKVGAFLRKTSLDEFPQFLNVLKGDMSLVGTRPPTEDEFERYDEHYRRRLSMTPGLTGLWQVSGRSEIESFDDVVRMDLKYIDNWSLTLDFKILLQTVVVVLFGRGAR